MSNSGKCILITLAAYSVLTGCASSQKLITPPLYLKDADVLYCTALNLHSTDKVIEIRVFDEQGDRRCGIGPRTLAPGEVQYQVCNGDLSIETDPVRYCVFTYDGSSGKVVGSAQIDSPEGQAVPALSVPASSSP